MDRSKYLIKGNQLNLSVLHKFQQKPAPFTPGEPLFWDDPHISKGMLESHLDPEIDRASRRPEIIHRSVGWIMNELELQQGDAVLDLGCGPGLYAVRLAQHGLKVTGVDASKRSITYARQQAAELGLDITFRYQNYLTLEDSDSYQAALLIFGDFCPLNPGQRSQLLANVRRSLQPGGAFVLDVTTPLHHQRYNAGQEWYTEDSGFWRPGPHLVLNRHFNYPEENICMDQMIVIEENSAVTVYRNWFQDYSPETITKELSASGFLVESIWGDLTGNPYREDSEWIGVVARKPGKK